METSRSPDFIVTTHKQGIPGKESLDVLKYAYLNSFYQTGLKNLLDVAVLDRKQELTGARQLCQNK